VFVLVEKSAEAIATADVEVGDRVRVRPSSSAVAPRAFGVLALLMDT
jgi:hypothetical protein